MKILVILGIAFFPHLVRGLSPLTSVSNTFYHHNCLIGTIYQTYGDGNQLKCWGKNYFGNLGYDRNENYGDEKEEKISDLLPIDLGDGYNLLQVEGSYHTVFLFIYIVHILSIVSILFE